MSLRVNGMNGNTDSGFEESDPECDHKLSPERSPQIPQRDTNNRNNNNNNNMNNNTNNTNENQKSVLLVVDCVSSVITSRDNCSQNSFPTLSQSPLDLSHSQSRDANCSSIVWPQPIRADIVEEEVEVVMDPIADIVIESQWESPSEEPEMNGKEEMRREEAEREMIVSDVEGNELATANTSNACFQLVRADTEESISVCYDSWSEYETQCLSEFFNNSQKGKSCDSYIQIRNHFIRHWISIRPKRFGYHDLLRKIGYLHLGNVTAFSRIQKFLEAHKVINVNALNKQQFARFHRLMATTNGQSVDGLPSLSVRRVSKGGKGGKKGKKSFAANQMKKLGVNSDFNNTVDENEETTAKTTVQSRTRPNNPFKLVPLESYESETQAPFQLRLSMEALAIVDIHSHCVKTEVIGLLGGRYDNKTQQLFILTAEPCASLDDHDLQCDMDPVSQADAKESLEKRSYQVVGWYHSHPTFLPNPSVRDLETQNQYQQLFSKESSQPFIALILSPYLNSANQEHGSNCLVSKFKCLWLSDQSNAQNDYKIPFELLPQMIRREKLLFSVTNKLKELCQQIKHHASKITMRNKIKRFRLPGGHEINYLDKLCESLSHYLLETGLSSVESKNMIHEIKRIIAQEDDSTPDDTRQLPHDSHHKSKSIICQ